MAASKLLPDVDAIFRAAQNRLHNTVVQSFQTERDPKHGFMVPKPLGYKLALHLARKCYEMGMMDALKAIEEVRDGGK